MFLSVDNDSITMRYICLRHEFYAGISIARFFIKLPHKFVKIATAYVFDVTLN